MKLTHLIARCLISFTVALSASDALAQADTLEKKQGWNERDRYEWYRGSQGSRLMPYSWFTALEQHNSEALFSNPEHLKQFNFIYPDTSTKTAKLGLPIGFTLDRQDDSKLVVTKLRWKQPQKRNELWMGMNCSACHTAQIDYKGTSHIIDGGPSLIDFQSFIENLDDALKATRNNDDKLMRFAKKVVSNPESTHEIAMLKKAMDKLIKWQTTTDRLDENAKHRYGYGRLDAFGHIFNKTVMFANLDPDNYEQSLDSMSGNPSDAPVSYPFLWGINKQWQVQWNGIVTNIVIDTDKIDSKLVKLFTWFAGKKVIDLGAMGRNTGEVLGVFGDVMIGQKILKDFGSPFTILASTGFTSSVNILNLNGLEKKVQKLTPPEWPATLPAINTQQAKKGKALFSEYKCHNCHTPTAKEISNGEVQGACKGFEDETGTMNKKGTECMDSFTASLSESVKLAIDKAAQEESTDADIDTALRSYTDILMACNAVTYTAKTGKLNGITVDDHKIQSVDQVATMLTASVKGVIFSNKRDLLKSSDTKKIEVTPPPLMADYGMALPPTQRRTPEKVSACITKINDIIKNQQCNKSKACMKVKALLAYKARPLDGIWATAPFLHNGSVPTLYDLLLPIDQRPTSFWVGSREFDPVKVGFVSSKPANGRATQLSTQQDGIMNMGNSNYGHDYNNASMTDEERWALVEYMKSL